MSKCRNCYSCAYFLCNYYNQFNVDRNMGCMDWTDEVVKTFVSSGINDLVTPKYLGGEHNYDKPTPIKLEENKKNFDKFMKDKVR